MRIPGMHFHGTASRDKSNTINHKATKEDALPATRLASRTI
jgi:hypothetical protein